MVISINKKYLLNLDNGIEIHNPRLVFIVGSIGILGNILGLFLFHDFKHHHKNKRFKDEERAYGYGSTKNIVDSYKDDIGIENSDSNAYLNLILLIG